MADVFERLKAALSDRYAIDREIGSGGMATVYLAEDLKHHRKVAVKVLRPELAAALGSERFLQEIEIAAQLHHPHILALYDSGDADGFLYYVMPFEEGQSLREKLAKEGELPVGDAVRVLRDVVDALSHAHKQDVVHRDIKPDNVMLSGRHALVTDFGVAKAVSEATGRQKLTTEGIALGTPAYMAPEQAAADPHIDHRADIYAVGAVAYELLTGRPPFSGTTQQEILAAHVTQAPEPLTKYRASVPPALEQLVLKCLEKRAADRWQSAEELIPQLEALATPSGGLTPTDTLPIEVRRRGPKRAWVFGAAILVALVVMFALASRFRTPAGTDVTAEPDSTFRTILVADFDHSPADSLLAMGVSEALRGRLQSLPGLFVPVRAELVNMCQRFIGPQGCPVDVDSLFQLARTFGMHGMLTGSVQRLGPGYVFSVSLRAAGGAPGVVSATETAEDSTDLVATVGRLADNLGAQLQDVMPDLEQAPADERPIYSLRSLDAYRVYRDAMRSWETDAITAVAGLRQAVRLDSSFAMAQRRLALGLYNLNIRRAEELRAIAAAYALRDQLRPWERGIVAGTYFLELGERDRAMEEYRGVLDDYPRYLIALNNLAVLYSDQREWDVAERLFRSISDTTIGSIGWYTGSWLETLLAMGQLDKVDSLLEVARAVEADTGGFFNRTVRFRMIAQERYFDLRDLDARASLGREPTQTDRFGQLSLDRYTALVLGQLTQYDSIASELARFHRDLDNPRGMLLQAFGVARVRLRFLDDSAAARSAVDEALAQHPFDRLEVLDRPYPELASLRAELGYATDAGRLLGSWEREVPTEYQGIDREKVDLARGDVALAAGRAAEALEHYRRGDILGCAPCNLPRFARAWDALGQTDSVIATYERYIMTPATDRLRADAFELANAYLRLGELYEQRGNRDNAVQWYNELLELWREADPELQPRTDDVRQRIARLSDEPRR
jgi:tetratricopeptide (TPR) repeat protein/tRNA A-37 threonylcarbamoyl transferase component Bud32